MALILSIDYDRRRTSVLADIVRDRLQSELVRSWSAKDGLEAIGGRIPDLILTPPFLSAKDEELIVEFLRLLGPAGAHIQRLAIPTFSDVAGAGLDAKASRAASWPQSDRRKRAEDAGCDPRQFADQIRESLAAAVAAASTGPPDDSVPLDTVDVSQPDQPGPEPTATEPVSSFGDLYVSTPADEAWATRTRQPIDALARPAVPGEAPVPVLDIGYVDDLDALALGFAVASVPSPPVSRARGHRGERGAEPLPARTAPVRSPEADSVKATPPEAGTIPTPATSKGEALEERVTPEAGAAAAARPAVTGDETEGQAHPPPVEPRTPVATAAASDVASPAALDARSPALSTASSSASAVASAVASSPEPSQPEATVSQAASVDATPAEADGVPPAPRTAADPAPLLAAFASQGPAVLDADALSMIGDAAFNALLFGLTDPGTSEPSPTTPPPDLVPAAAATEPTLERAPILERAAPVAASAPSLPPSPTASSAPSSAPPSASSAAPLSPPPSATPSATPSLPPPTAEAERDPEPDQPLAKVEAPTEDEWGIFDPDKAGFAALLNLQGGPDPSRKPAKGTRKGTKKRTRFP